MASAAAALTHVFVHRPLFDDDRLERAGVEALVETVTVVAVEASFDDDEFIDDPWRPLRAAEG